MPKNKFQDVIFTLIMVVVMVYAMVIYNISLDTGKLTNQVFLMAFGESSLFFWNCSLSDLSPKSLPSV